MTLQFSPAPILPPSPQLAAALTQIHETLDSRGITHEIAPVENDPLCYSCVTTIDENSICGGIAQNDVGRIIFLLYDDRREARDVAEGVDAAESQHWWEADSIGDFISFLVGEMRRDVAKWRAERAAALDVEIARESEKSA